MTTIHLCTTFTPADEADNTFEMREDSRLLRALFAAELADVAFTMDEVVALLNIMAGSMVTTTLVARPVILSMEVADAMELDVDESGECIYACAESLLAKMRALTPTQDAAVRDAIRRFRKVNDQLALEEALRSVGFVLID